MAANTSDALPITVRNVTKTYGSVYALNDVSINVKSGEFLTLLGPSGSGKTTLLMVLAGFTRPDRGSLLFGDREVIRTPPHQRDVGMVFQNYALFPHMTVAGNVGYPLRLRRVAKDQIDARVANALETVQLDGYGERRIDQLSGGQRQRVALARAIVFEPRILLMDEPLSALDKKLRDRMQIELRRLHERLGMTTVYVTHDQREALTMSDRIAVINHGKLMQLDAPEAIYNRPANQFVADFLGESTFLDVERHDGKVLYQGEPLMLSEAPPDGKLLLLMRPERMRLLSGEPSAGSRDQMNTFPAAVTDIVYQGDSYLLYGRLPTGEEVSLRGATHSDARAQLPTVGEDVTLGLHADDAVLISAEAGY